MKNNNNHLAIKSFEVLRSPVVSEKASRLQENNTYTFKVCSTATKVDVKLAIEHIFSVKVKSVNMLNVKGKKTFFKGRSGKHSDFKKAYVRLAEKPSVDLTGL